MLRQLKVIENALLTLRDQTYVCCRRLPFVFFPYFRYAFKGNELMFLCAISWGCMAPPIPNGPPKLKVSPTLPACSTPWVGWGEVATIFKERPGPGQLAKWVIASAPRRLSLSVQPATGLIVPE